MVPFMSFFLVEGLGNGPWIISAYSILAVSLTLISNKQFARRIDKGFPAFPLVGIAAAGYLFAVTGLLFSPSLWTALTIGVLGFGLSSSALSTMFSLGRSLAERHQIERSRFNAYMRATTSTAWMVGPAVTFLVADLISVRAVFSVALCVGLVWLALWWCSLPRKITAQARPDIGDQGNKSDTLRQLWVAAAFVFCLSLAHSLTFSSLPIFYVREIGLPGYAPGVAFSIKTFVEVGAIFSTPMMISRFGIHRSLVATSLLAVAAIQMLSMIETFPQMLIGAGLEGLYYGFYASLGISYIQAFAEDRPASATALYWNILMVTGLIAGPVVGLIATAYDFKTVVRVASGVAAAAALILIASRTRLRVNA
jgi:SET family sugar efflux transporter-like MFS transporter